MIHSRPYFWEGEDTAEDLKTIERILSNNKDNNDIVFLVKMIEELRGKLDDQIGVSMGDDL